MHKLTLVRTGPLPCKLSITYTRIRWLQEPFDLYKFWHFQIQVLLSYKDRQFICNVYLTSSQLVSLVAMGRRETLPQVMAEEGSAALFCRFCMYCWILCS